MATGCFLENSQSVKRQCEVKTNTVKKNKKTVEIKTWGLEFQNFDSVW